MERYKTLQCNFVEIYDDETGNETDNQRKFKAKTKKRFQRKSWDSGNATQQTLLELKKIRDAIYCCNDYKESELFESDIPLDIRQHIQKESEKLEDYLRNKDCEN